jgi:hypothetical protein
LGIEEPSNVGRNMERIRLIARIMAHNTRIAAIASRGTKGSKGKEIATLLTYHDTAEKLISVDGTVTLHKKDVVQRIFLSRRPTYPFTKIMFASPITK